ncbi:hypothetical protein Tco_0730045 [Tanacetum coccineum]|uniref:Uncharacterized protein n=1 Tax=Tanacetum coccineum TaxID=301880 RepID=A0ABQ4YQL6_9ASTR
MPCSKWAKQGGGEAHNNGRDQHKVGELESLKSQIRTIVICVGDLCFCAKAKKDENDALQPLEGELENTVERTSSNAWKVNYNRGLSKFVRAFLMCGNRHISANSTSLSYTIAKSHYPHSFLETACANSMH